MRFPYNRRVSALAAVGTIGAATLLISCSDSAVRLTTEERAVAAGATLLDQYAPGMSVIIPSSTPPAITAEIPGGRIVPLSPDAVRLPAGPLGIPGVAYKAYVSAADRMAREMPGCGVPWYLIAAIGRIESGHADGGNVDATGRTITPIMGPLLDGSLAGNNVVVASNSGGQVTYARALGPMQFLPGTWALFGGDNSGDGKPDVNNIFDAAYGTARYLCASASDLTDPANQRTAVFRYNNSAPYVANVLAWAKAYRDRAIPVGGIPEMTVPIPAPPPPPPPPPGMQTVVVVACPTTAPTTPVAPLGSAGHRTPGTANSVTPFAATTPAARPGAAPPGTTSSTSARPAVTPSTGAPSAAASSAPSTVFMCPSGMSFAAAPAGVTPLAGGPPVPGALPVPVQDPVVSTTPLPGAPRSGQPGRSPGAGVAPTPSGPQVSSSTVPRPPGKTAAGTTPGVGRPHGTAPTTTVTPPPR